MGDLYAVSLNDPDPSSPAAKHFVSYGDATKQGLAWKSRAWGALGPDGLFEAVITHTPG